MRISKSYIFTSNDLSPVSYTVYHLSRNRRYRRFAKGLKRLSIITSTTRGNSLNKLSESSIYFTIEYNTPISKEQQLALIYFFSMINKNGSLTSISSF